jgi:hypothetical protein
MSLDISTRVSELCEGADYGDLTDEQITAAIAEYLVYLYNDCCAGNDEDAARAVSSSATHVMAILNPDGENYLPLKKLDTPVLTLRQVARFLRAVYEGTCEGVIAAYEGPLWAALHKPFPIPRSLSE